MIWGPCLPPPAPPTKDRVKKCVKGRSYLCKKGVRYWSGKRLRDRVKDRAYHKANKEERKAYLEAHKEEIKVRAKAYRETHKEESKAYNKAYHEANKEEIKVRAKAYNEANKDKRKAYHKAYNEANKDKRKAYRETHKEEKKASSKAYYEAHKEESKAYYEAHKEKVKVRQKAYKPQRNKLRRERWKTDEIYKLKENLGSGLCNALKAQGASKNKRTLEYSCCTLAFLYAHLENQFTDGMTWANWSINGWHIDHRRPKKSFNLQNEEEIYMMQHWTNLQPMWGPENIAKGADYDPETFTHEWKGIDIGWVKK